MDVSNVSNQRRLPKNHQGMDYMHFLPWLVKMQSARNYLEVGVNMGHLLAKIAVETAIGVDPGFILDVNIAQYKNRTILQQTTSDRFFADEKELLGHYPPDVAFLDGMHLFEYLLRDFYNTEAACTKNSLIVMHDCLPLSAEMCDRNQDRARDLTAGSQYHGMWTGDVWKVVPILKKYRPDLNVVCIDAGPTGLICVSGLDTSSRVLADNYLHIVSEFLGVENTEASIVDNLYANIEIVSANRIYEGMQHGCYFRA